MQQELYDEYVNILNSGLIPALGCTEPIAIAYTAAKARQVLELFPESIEMSCSGNVIKNVKGVIVPNSSGMKGIDVAAVLGVVGGDADRELEVLQSVTDDDIALTKELLARKICRCSLAEGVENLYISARLTAGGHSATVTVAGDHTNIVMIEKDGEILLDKPYEIRAQDGAGDKSKLNVRDIITFADEVRLEDVQEVLDAQIRLNDAISHEGLTNDYGACVGKTLLEVWGNDVRTRACAVAAAGSDARMSGCSMAVVINSGSGNQGITVSLPVLEYAKEWGVSYEKLLRSLVVADLIAMHQKYFIGNLSGFCGAVNAACGAGAGITYMYGGTCEQISQTMVNTLGNIGGMICDGAKPSCAAKIASAVNAAVMGFYLSIGDRGFRPGEGIVQDDIEDTVRSVGYIGRVGMKSTDIDILNIMLGRIDVDKDDWIS